MLFDPAEKMSAESATSNPAAVGDQELQDLDVNEAAELLGVSTKTVRKLAHDGTLPARRVGGKGRLVFSRVDVESVLEKRKASQPIVTRAPRPNMWASIMVTPTSVEFKGLYRMPSQGRSSLGLSWLAYANASYEQLCGEVHGWGPVQCVVASLKPSVDFVRRPGAIEAKPAYFVKWAFVEQFLGDLKSLDPILDPDVLLFVTVPDLYVSAQGDVMGGWELPRPRGLRRTGEEHQEIRAGSAYGLPMAVAVALEKQGWMLRSTVFAPLPAPSPHVALDRPRMTHRMGFFFARSLRHSFDRSALEGHEDHWPDLTVDEMLLRAVMCGSKPGDVVLDLYADRGAVAASIVSSGRHVIGADYRMDHLETIEKALAAV